VCGHELCVKCALDLCSVIKSYDVPGIAGTIPCPLCRSGIASWPPPPRRGPPGVVQPGEETEHGFGPGNPPLLLRSSRRHVLISAADMQMQSREATAWVDIQYSRDTQIVWFCLLMLADGIGGFYFILFYFIFMVVHLALA
jgi:hypothetical protein